MPASRDDRLKVLVAETRDALRRYVRRLVGSTDTADEIVQEAYLRTYEIGDRANIPRAFLYSVARNLAIDRRRRDRSAAVGALGYSGSPDVVLQSPSPEAELLADERSRLLREAVERLPARCRAVFVLKVFHGYSYKEISKRLGISVRTVENHIAHALRQTHEYLRQRVEGRN